MVGGDPHVVLERQEEVVLHELVPHHVPVLPAQAVRRQLDCLVRRLELLVVPLDVVERRRVRPHLEAHPVGQGVEYHPPPRLGERREAAYEEYIDVPPPLDHGRDAVDEYRQDEVPEPIGSRRRPARPPVVLGERRHNEQHPERWRPRDLRPPLLILVLVLLPPPRVGERVVRRPRGEG